MTPAGWFNDVDVGRFGAIYVNAERANVIHKLGSHTCGLGFELAFLLPPLAW